MKSGICWKKKICVLELKAHKIRLHFTYKPRKFNIYVTTKIRSKIGNFKTLDRSQDLRHGNM